MSREQELSDKKKDGSKARKVFKKIAETFTWERVKPVAIYYLSLFVIALVITYSIEFFGLEFVVVVVSTLIIHTSLVRDTPLERSWGRW